MAQQADTEGAAKRKAGDEDEADVQAFLDRMAKALTAGDGRTAASTI